MSEDDPPTLGSVGWPALSPGDDETVILGPGELRKLRVDAPSPSVVFRADEIPVIPVYAEATDSRGKLAHSSKPMYFYLHGEEWRLTAPPSGKPIPPGSLPT
jgi:hypothetical protein